MGRERWKARMMRKKLRGRGKQCEKWQGETKGGKERVAEFIEKQKEGHRDGDPLPTPPDAAP